MQHFDFPSGVVDPGNLSSHRKVRGKKQGTRRSTNHGSVSPVYQADVHHFSRTYFTLNSSTLALDSFQGDLCLSLHVTSIVEEIVSAPATAMNDPGLDGPIADAATTVQGEHEKSQDDTAGPDMFEEEEEKSFLLPARWWYASTAFPLIAGTFGPMANAFSICALVENWRVSIPPGGTEEHGIDIPDSKW